MKRKVTVEGFVLHKKDLPNGDAVITVFTSEFGKVRCFAKGIQRITSRRAPHLQTGNLILLLLSEHGSGYYIEETTLLSGFERLRSSTQTYAPLYRMLFVLDRMLPENQTEQQSYNLTKHFFIDLSKEKSKGDTILQDYLNSFLHIQGYTFETKSSDELLFFIEELIHQKIPRISL